MTGLKKNLLSLVFLSCLLFPFWAGAESFNFTNDTGLSQTGGKAGFNQSKNDPNAFISPVITAVLSLVGVIFLGLMIFGGIKWMTAKGNDKQIDQAQVIIANATIGLVVVAAAYAISYFVLKSIASQSFKGIV